MKVDAMHSFAPRFIEAQTLTPQLIRTIRLLGEFKGRSTLLEKRAPQVLETLRRIAIIQSTESSNRIEGITASAGRIEKLVEEKTTPKNRSEQEIAGYRDVLNTIHANHPHIPCNPGVVRQFHRDLYRFLPQEGGRWKATDNEIVETRPDGTRIVRFKPVPAHQTPTAMERLHERFSAILDAGEVEPLLVIPAYVLDFLCIHPFRDGNGRMGRLLTLLLLYRAGYNVGRYISLEQLIESQRSGYYESLKASSQGWHEGTHTLVPWWEYFLGVMLLTAYRELESRTAVVTTSRGAKGQMVRDAIERLPVRFQYRDLERACPGVSRPTIHRVLAALSREGRVRCIKHGRDALWERT